MTTEFPIAARVDYGALFATVSDRDPEAIVEFMLETLPYMWVDAYVNMAPLRPTDICRIQRNSFEYIYDDYATLEAKGIAPADSRTEARLVAVLGRSAPSKRARDDYRLRGWVGPTETYFGKSFDKGHFIAHSIGGSVDSAELNVFVQRRDLNRGRSEEGERFRAMEKYCFLNQGTFCFNRPVYTDGSAKPAFVEFGLLKSDGEFWIEQFDNR